MSLIEEALRRVKEPLLSPTASPPQPSSTEAPVSSPTTVHSWPATPPIATSSATAPSVSATSTNAWLAVTMAVLVLTVALVVGGALWIRKIVGRSASAAPVQDIQPVEPVAAAVEPSITAQAPSPAVASVAQGRRSPVPADLVLSGVVEGVGESYAVINGLIVGIGDRVEGLELTEIANGSVTLRRSDGQELTLRVPR